MASTFLSAFGRRAASLSTCRPNSTSDTELFSLCALPRAPKREGRRATVLERWEVVPFTEFWEAMTKVCDLCMRLGGARGPPGTHCATGGRFAGRGVVDKSVPFLGGLLDSVFTRDGGANGLSFLRLALRPSEAKKLPGDLATEEGETAERLDEDDDVAIMVDAREGPPRGVAAKAG